MRSSFFQLRAAPRLALCPSYPFEQIPKLPNTSDYFGQKTHLVGARVPSYFPLFSCTNGWWWLQGGVQAPEAENMKNKCTLQRLAFLPNLTHIFVASTP